MKRKFKRCIAVLSLACATFAGCSGETKTKPNTANSGAAIDNFRHTVAFGEYHIAAIKNDGTVVATGDNSKGQCDVEAWTDIISIQATKNGTVGQRSDGSIVVAGDIPWADFSTDQDIESFSLSDRGGFAYMLSADGQDQIHGTHRDTLSIPSDWDDVRYVAVYKKGAFGIKKDGTVTFAENNYADLKGKEQRIKTFYKPYDWSDIQQIATGGGSILGLTSTGRIESALTNVYQTEFTGDQDDRYCKVTGSINAVYGLTTDGKIKGSYTNNPPELIYEKYLDKLNSKRISLFGGKNVYVADIEASENCPLLAEILSDGTLHLELINEFNEYTLDRIEEAQEWTDLMVIDRTK